MVHPWPHIPQGEFVTNPGMFLLIILNIVCESHIEEVRGNLFNLFFRKGSPWTEFWTPHKLQLAVLWKCIFSNKRTGRSKRLQSVWVIYIGYPVSWFSWQMVPRRTAGYPKFWLEISVNKGAPGTTLSGTHSLLPLIIYWSWHSTYNLVGGIVCDNGGFSKFGSDNIP